MAAAEESRQILSGATLALKRLGRAEWSEIKGIGSPGESIVRLMGAVRPDPSSQLPPAPLSTAGTPRRTGAPVRER